MTPSILISFICGAGLTLLVLYLADLIHKPQPDKNPSFGGMAENEREEKS